MVKFVRVFGEHVVLYGVLALVEPMLLHKKSMGDGVGAFESRFRRSETIDKSDSMPILSSVNVGVDSKLFSDETETIGLTYVCSHQG